MKIEERHIGIIDINSSIYHSVLKITDNGTTVKLEVSYKDIIITELDSFPFNALKKIRLQLEGLGRRLICQGSRVDVYPSGMQSDSFFAYELELSKPATKYVDILDYTEFVNKIATVKEQEDFFEEWLISVGFNDKDDIANLENPKSLFGTYWYIVSLDNWKMQSIGFKEGIIASIMQELNKIKTTNKQLAFSIKSAFEKKANIKLNI